MTRKIETIEDVNEALAEVKQALAEVNAADLSEPEAWILFEPLMQLQGALTRTAAQIAAVMIARREEEE